MLSFFYIFEVVLVFGTILFVLINGYTILFGAPYVPSTDHRVKEICDLLKIKRGDVTCDLGSGNGSIVIEMANRGAQAHGFEANPYLVLYSRYRIRKVNLHDRAHIHFKDFWFADFSKFSKVSVYLTPYVMKRLETKLQKELKRGSLVAVETCHFPNWKPIEVHDHISVYRA